MGARACQRVAVFTAVLTILVLAGGADSRHQHDLAAAKPRTTSEGVTGSGCTDCVPKEVAASLARRVARLESELLMTRRRAANCEQQHFNINSLSGSADEGRDPVLLEEGEAAEASKAKDELKVVRWAHYENRTRNGTEGIVDQQGLEALQSGPDGKIMLALRRHIYEWVLATKGPMHVEKMMKRLPLDRPYCKWRLMMIFLKCNAEGHVKSLKMNLLHGFPLPPEVFELKNVQSLKLMRRGKLPTTPDDFMGLTKLTALKKLAMFHPHPVVPPLPTLEAMVSFRSETFNVMDGFFEGTPNLKRFVFNVFKRVDPSVLKGIGTLKHLEKLSVTLNGNSSLGWSDRLPDEVLGLKGLKKFMWTGNSGDRKNSVQKVWSIPMLPDPTQLEYLVLNGLGLKELPGNLEEAKRLKHLRVAHNGLSEYPNWLVNLPRLRNIMLSHNNFTVGPNAAFKVWKEGREFSDIGNPYLDQRPEDIDRVRRLLLELQSLTDMPIPEFNGKNPCVTSALQAFLQCEKSKSKIVQINLSSLMLRRIPLTVLEFEQVQDLVLTDNLLTELPSLGSLKNLRSLYIDQNRFKILHAGIFDAPILKILYAGYNMIETVEDGIDRRAAAETVEDLWLMGNQFREVPDSLTYFRKLKTLYLEENRKLSKLPREMGRLTDLFSINLGGADLSSDILAGVDWPVGLGEFQCRHCGLTRFPKIFTGEGEKGSLYRRVFLRRLDFGNNPMTEVPEDAIEVYAKSASMKHLFLDDCLLEEIPLGLVRIKVQELDLRKNKIDAFPAEVLAQMRCGHLRLGFNQITELPAFTHPNGTLIYPPTGEFRDYTRISLNNNMIRTVGPGMIAALKASVKEYTIHLHNNEIDEFAPDFRIGPSDSVLLDDASLLVFTSHDGLTSASDAAIDRMQDVIQMAFSGEDMVESDFMKQQLRLATLSTKEKTDVTPVGEWELPKDEIPLFKDCITFKFRVNGASLGIVRCQCLSKFYADLWNPRECRQCPQRGVCEHGAVHCVEGSFYRPKNATTGDDEGADGMRMEAECAMCPDGGDCPDGRVVVALPGYWKQSVASANVIKCANSEACLGGNSNSTCAEGYDGLLCGKCSRGYYSSGNHQCIACPSPTLSIVYFSIGLLGMGALAVLFFVLAASLLDESSAKKRKGRIRDMSATLKSTSSLKGLVSFMQVLTSLDMTFDIDWPNCMDLLDNLFGWVNLDIMKTTSLECVWEIAAMDSSQSAEGTVEDAGFGYHHKMTLTSCIPFGVSALLFGVYIVTKCALRIPAIASRTKMTVAKVKRLCIHSHILVWQLCYLPVSYMAIQFFNCVSFDGGSTHYLHNDLSTSCYTHQYWSYSAVALVTIACYTIGMPLGIAVYVALKRKVLYEPRMLQSVGVMYRSYKKEYAYWEAVEMARKVIIGGFVVLLSGSSTFQITVALMVVFVSTVLHCRCWPNQSNFSNYVQALLLSLTYFTMSLGVLRSLEVPAGQRSLFSVVVVGLDLSIVAVVLGLIAFDVVCLIRDQINDSIAKLQKHRRLASKLVARRNSTA